MLILESMLMHKKGVIQLLIINLSNQMKHEDKLVLVETAILYWWQKFMKKAACHLSMSPLILCFLNSHILGLNMYFR